MTLSLGEPERRVLLDTIQASILPLPPPNWGLQSVPRNSGCFGKFHLHDAWGLSDSVGT